MKDNMEKPQKNMGVNKPSTEQHSGLFHNMAVMPWPYMCIFPIAFCLLIGFGWTKEDIIENEVNNIWVKRTGSYWEDQQYAKSLHKDGLTASAFAAMSISRDGGNLFTQERLNIVRDRMNVTETVVIKDGQGREFTWADFCFTNGGFPYEFPCIRLTPMDFYQEANWFFDHPEDTFRRTWYSDLIGDVLVDPRIPRFKGLTDDCAPQCVELLAYRTIPTSPGFSPLSLFSDLGDLEYSDPCRICIEETYEADVTQLVSAVGPSFGVLAQELQKYATATDINITNAQRAEAADLAGKSLQLFQTITPNDVRDFYKYYVVRGTYAALGAPSLLAGYLAADIPAQFAQCYELGPFAEVLGLTCPPVNVTLEDAEGFMLAHADADFSSITTAGSPLPLWGAEDGTGAMLAGDRPVGGSGIDMSGNLLGMFGYIDLPRYGMDGWTPPYSIFGNGYAEPGSELWNNLVDTNPVFNWFMASVTEADEGQKCGNGDLLGTSLDPGTDSVTAALAANLLSTDWCHKYTVPNDNDPGDSTTPYTKQYFARMWYDLLIASDAFLAIVEGVQDPYLWTTGQGCGYDLRGARAKYTNETQEAIMDAANGYLYSLDEGVSVGVVVPDLIIGGVEFSPNNTRTSISVIQTLYATLKPADIVERVRSCKRPGGPVEITEEEADDLLFNWKEQMENAWTQGWDDDDQPVQFVGLFDDSGPVGTTGRMLEEITLDNNTLTAISILLIAVFSALFLFSSNSVESRVLVTLVGVALVVVAFFGAVGFALLTGVKISVSIAWTLPFIILGLGVDDMYIVLESIKETRGYTEGDFLDAMKEVIVPVSMTSIVNASMFAILNISDIPAIYLTSRVAVYAVISLYAAIIFCFPAYCYLDMRRQASGKRDIFFCSKASDSTIAEAGKGEDFRAWLLYDKFYEPLMLGDVRMLTHALVWIAAAALVGIGAYGITEREIGLGLEDFFPESNQASVWATKRTEELASWTIGIRWGELHDLDTDPMVPLKLIKQFEGVVGSSKVVDVDTKQVWMANFLIWNTEYCDQNFARDDFDVRECGHDKIIPDTNGTTCSAVWIPNTLGLRSKKFSGFDSGVCIPGEGGICRPVKHLHPNDQMKFADYKMVNGTLVPGTVSEDDVFCPTIKGWSPEAWQFCLREWRNATGVSGNSFIFEGEEDGERVRGTPKECAGEYHTDQEFAWPIKHSGGPGMFSFNLFSHQDTLDMISETRAQCDDSELLRCWLTGIPFDYWSQYDGIFEQLVKLSGTSVGVGFGIAFIFLFAKFSLEGLHPSGKIILGSVVGAIFIALTIIMSLVAVVGVSILAGVSLTGFSNMSFVLSVGFSVEYSVHVVSRWLRADLDIEGIDRVKHTMSFLMLPTFMSFVSSTIGVACLAFTEFSFNQVFFFRPLITVMMVTYFYGIWWLPAALCLVDIDAVKLGKHPSDSASKPEEQEQDLVILDSASSVGV